jgi:two-component system, OmpR family, sensor histidine kinase CssS
MRRFPLSVKIWSVFAAITLGLFLLLAGLLPWLLQDFFTKQIYDILIDSQRAVQTVPGPMDRIHLLPDPSDGPLTRRIIAPRLSSEGPVVQHLLINPDTGVNQNMLPGPFVEAIESDAAGQTQSVQTYARSINDRTIFYVIRKEHLEGKPGFMVSYSWGNYRNDLVQSMYGRLLLLMIIVLLLSWIPCLWLARYVSRPLVKMEAHVGRMAERDWHEPLVTSRTDEIGRLSKAIETMRRRLVRQDQSQQFFLQNISHELKTPVMVIRSYAQSILDGLLPKGTLHASVEVIQQEAARLEKRIRDLLYLNKLSYMSSREKSAESFDLREVLEDVVERLRFRRPEVEWKVELSELPLCGDREQWVVAIENVLDNQLRYAKQRVEVTAKDSGAVRFWNDGRALEAGEGERIFEPFRTGAEGEFGLGLAIVKQILNHHGAAIHAANEQDGVAFTIRWSL